MCTSGCAPRRLGRWFRVAQRHLRRHHNHLLDLSVHDLVGIELDASGTEWAEAGIAGATVTAMVVRGLVDRDSAARLVLTRDGRAVLDALLGE